MTTPVELTEATLVEGLARLAAADPALARLSATVGRPPLRRRPPGFATLLDAILGQQVSTASAAAIRAKLIARVDPVTPDAILALDPEDLRACGFSRRKIDYARDLATRLVDGRLDLDRLVGLDDEPAIAELTRVAGIGRWTAEIYLLFALGRPDVWPAGDLAVVEALRALRGLDRRPPPAQATRLAVPWRPWRGAAAHLLWHSYRHMTGRVGAPVAADGTTP